MPWWFLLAVVLSCLAMVLAVLGFTFPPGVDTEVENTPHIFLRLPYRRDELQHYAPELQQLKTHYQQALGEIGTKHHLITNFTEHIAAADTGEYFLLVTSQSGHRPSLQWSGTITMRDGYNVYLQRYHVKIASPHWVVPITQEEQIAAEILSETKQLLDEWTKAALAILNRR